MQRMWICMKFLHLLSLISTTTSLNLDFPESASLANQSQHKPNIVVNSKPPQVNEKVCTDDSKAGCANLSSVVDISVEKAQKAMQLVCNNYYKDEVFLTKKDVIEAVEKTLGHEPPSKKLKSDKVKQVI